MERDFLHQLCFNANLHNDLTIPMNKNNEIRQAIIPKMIKILLLKMLER